MSSSRRLQIAILFGGRSAEHEVSLVSATSIIAALDKRRYSVIPIGILPDGTWRTGSDLLKRMKEGRPSTASKACSLSLDPRRPGLLVGTSVRRIDVLFPVLHGTFGEDGTMQGLFELAGIAYVGSGVLGSSAGMDKIVTKQLCEHAGVADTEYRRRVDEDEIETALHISEQFGEALRVQQTRTVRGQHRCGVDLQR